MITEADKEWLSTNYSTLKFDEESKKVIGKLEFTAIYDHETGDFTVLDKMASAGQGVVITDSYEIEIHPAKKDGSLPLLMVLGNKVPIKISRHFYNGGSACLCGPTEEFEFFKDGYSFPRFLRGKVIPFLYAQSYYDLHKKWPWGEYAHGAAGIFQSYLYSGTTKEHADLCVRRLHSLDTTWNRVRNVILGLERVTETVPCFCGEHKQMRLCKPGVWNGIFKLQEDVKKYGLSIPGPYPPKDK